jgi:3'-5' exoribonuclease
MPNVNNENEKKFLAICHSIQSKTLQTFIVKTLSNSEINTAFISSPASVSHHHCERGGLLAHSVEVGEIVSRFIYKNNDERDICIVAALFHDMGKIKVYNEFGRLNTLGKLVSHDALTLEVCASALSQLDADWPDAAITLRHIWTCASPGARYGNQSATPLTHIIRSADKISVDRYMHKKQLDTKTNNANSNIIWHNNQYFWQPKQEQKMITTRRKRWVF